MMKKFFAFTLAEVLITLTIIGVIAALTIPNLMQSYQEHATVNKVKKFYSTLTNAYAQAVKENGTIDEWGIKVKDDNSTKKLYEILFAPYFKISKNCGLGNVNCEPKTYTPKRLDGNYSGENNELGNSSVSNKSYSVLLSDGSNVMFKIINVGNEHGDYINIFYDSNGFVNTPNQWGVDFWGFAISSVTNYKVLPIGMNSNSSDCLKNNRGSQCAKWVIYKGNMDYLHCSDLSWNGKSKCK